LEPLHPGKGNERKNVSRYKPYREPRRRGFDDDFAPPPPRGGGGGGMGGGDRPYSSAPRQSMPIASGPPVDATVSWFNAEKGFGFVQLSDGSGDAFLHASALQASGHDSVPPGATLSVRVGQGQKGPQVAEVLSVDTSTADPNAGARPRTGGMGAGGGGGFGGGAPRPARRMDDGPTQECEGTVKWYNPDKGFGFITPETGGKDVFIHASAIQRAGLTGLVEGQRVLLQVGQGQKGPEARSVQIVGNRSVGR
jgi:cold shock protein